MALAELAKWRPQAVIADAMPSSPLGLYLTQVLGPPSILVDDLIAWRLSVEPPAAVVPPQHSA
jgi:hypothetical protein